MVAFPEEKLLSQDQTARLYDRLSWVYDVWAALTEGRARRRMLALANVKNGEHVLEVAVGTGLAFAEIVRANPGGRNIGIDLSEGMLTKARRRLARAGATNFTLRQCSGFATREPDDAFDLVVNNYMLDLLPSTDWPTVLAEFRRVLKPGGRLILTSMAPGEGFGSGIYQRLARISPWLLGACREVHLSGPLEGNGFRVQTREYIQQLLFPSEIILAMKR